MTWSRPVTSTARKLTTVENVLSLSDNIFTCSPETVVDPTVRSFYVYAYTGLGKSIVILRRVYYFLLIYLNRRETPVMVDFSCRIKY